MRRFFFVLVLLALLAGCGGSGAKNTPGNAVISYLEALLTNDRNKLNTVSCPDWGPQAIIEADSFSAVSARLDNAVCKDTGTSGDFTLVTCTGKMIANYGGEDQEFPLEGKTYQVKIFDGEWRMCGYQ